MTTQGPPFGQDSMVWKVNRETAIGLAGGRALLLQFAHPGVAAGVDEHSYLRQDLLRRLGRTFEIPLRLMFGDTREAARHINQAHRKVQGPGYRASDPDLMVWVGATLVDSALDAYARFFRPLSPAERDVFYRETRQIGPLLGVPDAAFPATYRDFAAYWSDMLNGDQLRVDDRARALADAVRRPPSPLLLPVWKPLDILTAGLLPERFRDAYRLPWGPREQRAFRVLVAAVRASRHLPAPVRVMPVARRAARRRPRPDAQAPTSATQLPSGSDT